MKTPRDRNDRQEQNRSSERSSQPISGHKPPAAKPATPGTRPLIANQTASPLQRRASQLTAKKAYQGPLSDWTNAVFRPDLYQQPASHESAGEARGVQNPPAGRAESIAPTGAQAHTGSTMPGAIDELSEGGHLGNEQYIDQTGGTGAGAAAGAGATAAGAGAATGAGAAASASAAAAGAAAGSASHTTTAPAVPTNLVQTVTSWAPGATKYGFQLSFSCSSSSGRVADLQSQSSLRWREYVTYSRNDFAHRINPSNPTILPPGGGIPFTSPAATAVGVNSLVFNTARDTHWMPTSAVRLDDFAPTATPPRTLPAIMQSSQIYQYSTDGSTWTTFAGPFTLSRTFAQAGSGHTFTTNKVGIHSVTENYKP